MAKTNDVILLGIRIANIERYLCTKVPGFADSLPLEDEINASAITDKAAARAEAKAEAELRKQGK